MQRCKCKEPTKQNSENAQQFYHKNSKELKVEVVLLRFTMKRMATIRTPRKRLKRTLQKLFMLLIHSWIIGKVIPDANCADNHKWSSSKASERVTSYTGHYHVN